MRHEGTTPIPGFFWFYRCKCSCGWRTKRRWSADRAMGDMLMHMTFASVG